MMKWNSVSGGKITFKAVTLSIYLPWLETPTENFSRFSVYLLRVKSLAASGKPNPFYPHSPSPRVEAVRPTDIQQLCPQSFWYAQALAG